ncbi:MAG: TMEM43 family protein, partial [Thermoanaerobaculia bacterium]|nr:TMEM43 family protein [Thermoanaerobaculia bacterium]
FWGEGRAVKRAKTLNEGAGEVIAVSAQSVDPSREGKLIHTQGRAQTDETLADPSFGIEAPGALALQREVEMYQWIEESKSEERKKLGGGTETVTTYTYHKDWSSSSHASSSFKDSQGHENPSFPVSADAWRATTVNLGAMTLGESLSLQINRSESRDVNETDLQRVPAELRANLRAVNGRFYWGDDPSSPRVGDARIGFKTIQPTDVTVVGQQRGSNLDSYKTKVGGTIALLSYGAKTPEEMFDAAKAANSTLSWILRAVGFFVIFLGFLSIFKPLSVMADVVPFLGNLMEKGTFFLSLLCAAIVTLITIAVGWIFFRPLLGVALFALAAGLTFWILKRSRKPAMVPAPAPSFVPPPPPPPPPG